MMEQPQYHFDLEQRSDAWRLTRKGRFTGTDASLLIANGKSQSGLGTGAETALFLKASEFITDYQQREFDNYATAIGTEREPEAIALYEEIIFPQSVAPCGFISLGDYFGFSPDGLVGDDGLIEAKCPQAPEYLRYITTREINPKYICQMQWGMWVSKRKWCDHIVFNPEFGGYPMDVQRIQRDGAMMKMFEIKASAVQDAMDSLLFTYEKLSK